MPRENKQPTPGQRKVAARRVYRVLNEARLPAGFQETSGNAQSTTVQQPAPKQSQSVVGSTRFSSR